jgi:hypothetical protein
MRFDPDDSLMLFTPDDFDPPQLPLTSIMRKFFIDRKITYNDFVAKYLEYLENNHPDMSKEDRHKYVSKRHKLLLYRYRTFPESYREILKVFGFEVIEIRGTAAYASLTIQASNESPIHYKYANMD